MSTQPTGPQGSTTTLEATPSPAPAAQPQPKPSQPAPPSVDVIGFGSAAAFGHIQRVAAVFAASSLVPPEFQQNLPNCVIALNMANRMGADPLMVMQNLYVVYGRPGWSSQFLIATFNQNGRFTAIRYEFVGEPGKDSHGCRAWCVEKSTGERLVGSTITVELAKKEGWWDRKSKDGKPASKWPNMTEQMLMYRSASWFIRTYAPEIAMGLQTAEEITDVGPEMMDEIVRRTESRLALQSVIDGAPSKLDAVVDAAKTGGNGAPNPEPTAPAQATAPESEKPKTAATTPEPDRKGKSNKPAAAVTKEPASGNPNYAESEPEPENLFGR